MNMKKFQIMHSIDVFINKHIQCFAVQRDILDRFEILF